jgi:hypothetical protein
MLVRRDDGRRSTYCEYSVTHPAINRTATLPRPRPGPHVVKRAPFRAVGDVSLERPIYEQVDTDH